jgi:phytoene synthase
VSAVTIPTTTQDLDAAGIREPLLRRAYAECDRLLAAHHVPVRWMRSMLPPHVRPYQDAMLAFWRYADDLADDPGRSLVQRRADFDGFIDAFARILRAGPGLSPAREPDEPDDTAFLLRLAFSDFARTWHIEEESIFLAVQATRDDIGICVYDTVADLERFMNAAGQVATWLSTMLGLTDHSGAVAWSSGFQILDNLSDLREDVRLGKLYFPLEDLPRCGVRREDIERDVAAGHATDGVRRLVGLQAERAGRFFASAEEWCRRAPAPGGEVFRLLIGQAQQVTACLARYGHDPFTAFAAISAENPPRVS